MNARLSYTSITICLLFIGMASGCLDGGNNGPRLALRDMAANSDFGHARAALLKHGSNDIRSRDFLLDRLSLLRVSLLEGLPDAGEQQAAAIYETLRTQGVNAGRDSDTFFLGERESRHWKGEPFEQAMAFATIAMLDGMQADWGNMQASAGAGLFLLRDFTPSLERLRESSDVTTDDADMAINDRLLLIKEAKRWDQQRDTGEQVFDEQRYQMTPRSDFELGYVLRAIAARANGDADRMRDAIASLRLVAPDLSRLANEIENGQYDTVLVVEYGQGPRKYAAGPDGALALYEAMTPSDNHELVINQQGDTTYWPIVTDTNRLAADLRWNSLEDLRIAKSTIGDALVAGGLIAASESDDDTTQIVGAGVALAGLLMKSTAGADTRHCPVLPQRTYVTLLQRSGRTGPVRISIAGHSESEVVLPELAGPDDQQNLALQLVRLPERRISGAAGGTVRYANDSSGEVQRQQSLPYILGGNCVRVPSAAVLDSYQQSGFLTDMTLDDLRDLYREEGITFEEHFRNPADGLHVLEGGDVLYTPRVGSIGFIRLFCAQHEPYLPRSERVREIARRYR